MEKLWEPGLVSLETKGNLMNHINITKVDAQRMVPNSFQRCPAPGTGVITIS